MKRDLAIEREITRAADALGKALMKYSKKTGRRLTFFGETGGLFVIDADRDDELALSGYRAYTIEDGGSIVLNLGCAGGAKWDGGGW